jgi:hypothetical protein
MLGLLSHQIIRSGVYSPSGIGLLSAGLMRWTATSALLRCCGLVPVLEAARDKQKPLTLFAHRGFHGWLRGQDLNL